MFDSSRFGNAMPVAHVARGFQVAGFDGVEEFAQCAQASRESSEPGRGKSSAFLPCNPHLVIRIIGDERRLGSFEHAADVSHVLESRQRRRAEAERQISMSGYSRTASSVVRRLGRIV